MADHSLVIDNDLTQTVTHPEVDRDGCDFDAYVASDWANAEPATWLFTWHPGGEDQPAGYWNGSRIG